MEIIALALSLLAVILCIVILVKVNKLLTMLRTPIFKKRFLLYFPPLPYVLGKLVSVFFFVYKTFGPPRYIKVLFTLRLL